MSCKDDCPKSRELYRRRIAGATEHPPHDESSKQERSSAMSQVFQQLYGPAPLQVEPPWTREQVEGILEKSRRADQGATVFIEQRIQQIITDENIETGIAYFITGLRIYEPDEEKPRYVIAEVVGGGWLGFLDVAKLINGRPAE